MNRHKDLAVLDRPEIVNFLFYPRRESGAKTPENVICKEIPMPDGTPVGIRMHCPSPDLPVILFFHGNGEIAQDYDPIGPVYNEFQMNFIVADFRGYGRSGGRPGIVSMFEDAHEVLTHVRAWMTEKGFSGGLWIMGRSLGSAPAIDLAAAHPENISGLIVESGFSQTLSLLERLGIDITLPDGDDARVFSNARAIAGYPGPLLVMHGRYDRIIPVQNGHELYEKAPGLKKRLHIVENADHNTIMMEAGRSYFEIISEFIGFAGRVAIES
ncbi:MAG: alpha/beta hydrolase [Deltaproteobacteria bacterium]|nr:alpha/beta hydrolase [Deltaproteobacteria bacterium]